MQSPPSPCPAEPPEIELQLACQACGCHAAFAVTALAPRQPVNLRCCQCGAARRDLAALYDEATQRAA